MHNMELIETRESGEEEWFCPECDRRFLMKWPPDFGRTILDEGDGTVSRTGGKSGIAIEADVLHGSGLPKWMEKELEDLDFGEEE